MSRLFSTLCVLGLAVTLIGCGEDKGNLPKTNIDPNKKEAPEGTNPKENAPKTETPKATTPKTETPELTTPKTETPEATTPEEKKTETP